MSLAFLDPILALLGQNGPGLCECVIASFLNFYRSIIKFPGSNRYLYTHVSSYDFSSSLKLEIQPSVRNINQYKIFIYIKLFSFRRLGSKRQECEGVPRWHQFPPRRLHSVRLLSHRPCSSHALRGDGSWPLPGFGRIFRYDCSWPLPLFLETW